MRERRVLNFQAHCNLRITPAYAGKTWNEDDDTANYRDHPRVCGKDQYELTSPSGNSGSPPRMRERLPDGARRGGVVGITPAYAGKTVWRSNELAAPRDHPRVCGKDRLS